MHTYRLYFLNDEGRFRAVKELACADDEQALNEARRHGESGLELWDLGRLVAAWPPQPVQLSA